jgi:hypothetical protein
VGCIRRRRCCVGILRCGQNGAMAKMGIKVTPELDLDTMQGQRKKP